MTMIDVASGGALHDSGMAGLYPSMLLPWWASAAILGIPAVMFLVAVLRSGRGSDD